VKLRLDRLFVVDGAQIGALYIVHAGAMAPSCFTLEDERREVKVPGETCIPPGTFELELRKHGGMFERYRARWPWNEPGMLELMHVPGFADVLMHCGVSKDHTRGCVLVGRGAFVRGALTESAQAYETIYKRVSATLLQGERCYIDVRDINAAL
jgi:hypothetical protein